MSKFTKSHPDYKLGKKLLETLPLIMLGKFWRYKKHLMYLSLGIVAYLFLPQWMLFVGLIVAVVIVFKRSKK